MPRNTRRKPASFIAVSKSSSSARFTLASVNNENGNPFLLPLDQRRAAADDVFLVADEIVVDDEERTAPAELFQGVKLGEHLLITLRARHAAVDLDDVAKLA